MESIDKNNICRLCLLSSDDLSYIFEVNVRNGFVAAELIKDLLQFKVLEDDGYPNVVCPVCLSKLTDFQHFKEQCQTYKVTYDNVFSSNEELMDCPSEPATNPLEGDPSETEEDVPPQFEFGSIKKEPEEITVEEERPLKIDYDAVCSDKGEETANYIPIQPCSSTAVSGPRKEVPSQTPLTSVKAEPAETSEEGETSRTSEQESSRAVPLRLIKVMSIKEAHSRGIFKAGGGTKSISVKQLPMQSVFKPVGGEKNAADKPVPTRVQTVTTKQDAEEEEEMRYSPIDLVQTSFGKDPLPQFGVHSEETLRNLESALERRRRRIRENTRGRRQSNVKKKTPSEHSSGDPAKSFLRRTSTPR